MSLDHMYTVLTRTYVLGSYVYLPGLLSLDHAYTYQDLRPWIICIHYTYQGPTSLDHMYTVLTRTYVLGSYVYCTYQDLCPWIICILYQDLCPWIICILTRTYVLGSYVYLPGLMTLDHMYTYQDLRPWIICILTRTYILGSYVYLPGPRSLEKTTDKQAQDRLTHKQKNMGRSMYRQVEIEVYRCWIQK